MTLRDPLSTKIKILDAAEVVYALEGIEGLTLRVITERAGVNLASINYHFGHKEALTHAMLSRVLTPLYEERLSILRHLETAFGQRLRPTHVVAAILLPLVRELTRPGQPAHRLPLYGRTATDPSPLVRGFMESTFADITDQFDKAFVRSACDLPKEEALWRSRVFFNALPGTISNQNTGSMLAELLLHPGISAQDILIRFGTVMESVTLGNTDDDVMLRLSLDTLNALADSRTLRELAHALPLTQELASTGTVSLSDDLVEQRLAHPSYLHS